MMFNRNFVVKIRPIKANYVQVPDHYMKLISVYRNGCLILSYRNEESVQKSVYVSYLPTSRGQSLGLDSDIEIGMSAQLAKNLNVKEGTNVGCSLVSHVNAVKSCTVSCNNCDDYSMLESSTNAIRNSLLDQVTVVNVGQSLTVWLNNKISINVVVENLNPPFNYGKLQTDTDLILNCPKPSIKDKIKAQTLPEPKPVEPPSFLRAKRQERLENSTASNGFPKRNSFIERSATEDISKLRRNSSFTSPDIDHKRNNEKIAAFESILNDQSKKLRNSILNKLDEFKISEIPEHPEREKPDNKLMMSASVSNIPSTKPKIETPKRAVSETVDNRNQLKNLIKTLEKENKKIFYYRVLFDSEKDAKFPQVNEVYMQKSKQIDSNCNFLMSSKSGKQYSVKVKFLDSETQLANDIVEVNSFLANSLNLSLYEKVSLQELVILANIVEKIEIVPATKLHLQIATDVEDKFKKYIVKNAKLSSVVINNNQHFKLSDYIVKIQLYPTSLPYCQIDANCFRDCSVEVSKDKIDETLKNSFQKKPEKKKDDNEIEEILKFSKYDKIVESSVESISGVLMSDRFFLNSNLNTLISGSNDSGKSMVCKEIQNCLSKCPININVTTINCSKFKGRKPDSIIRDLREIFNSCLYSSPSVVILLNLDSLAQVTNDDHHTQDDEYYKKVSDFLRRLIEEYSMEDKSSLLFIATVEKESNLNKRLCCSQGLHLFKNFVKIPNLEKDDREEVLAKIIKNFKNLKIDKAINWTKIINLTEGYSFGDMKALFDRAVFFAIKKSPKTPFLTEELLKKSLDISNKLFMDGVKTETTDDEDLYGGKIPGMDDVMTVFEEVLVWPSRYPKIFKNSPLRNQAGILLYGVPGCGKTFIVNQIAKRWNLRMISIKGPELLAKYIGQSEENVRSLFEKAKHSKPCVIFFDEFDSLAPRRGHDSTGVTDRVVNQLLTELDGVKSLEGVTIIGATSRPDLLDPALLRSGRIDRIVELKIPSSEDRLNIFKSIGKTVKLDDDVDLKQFSKDTKNYTGADIKSLFTTANMMAITEFLNSNPNISGENIEHQISVKKCHMLKSLSETKPSQSEQDLKRYKKLYENFVSKTTVNTETVSKKISLA